MILSDKTILQEMEQGNIIISPFQEEHLNPNSVDLTLAPACKVYARKIRICSYIEMPIWVKQYGAYTDIGGGGFQYEEPLDVKDPGPINNLIIKEEGFVLLPNEFYLYACNERIGVLNTICATVMAKSSLGRLGLDIVIGPAGFIDSGFQGSLVLEMRVARPLRIYPNMKICQIKFERVEGEVIEPYHKKKGSKYAGQVGVQETLYHKNFI